METSRILEKEIDNLRAKVDGMLTRGVAEVVYERVGYFTNTTTTVRLLRDIAKAQGRVFLLLEGWPNHKEKGALRALTLTIPATKVGKALASPLTMVGVVCENQRELDRSNYDVAYYVGGSVIKFAFNTTRGMEAVKSWMHMVYTNKDFRFMAGLPTHNFDG